MDFFCLPILCGCSSRVSSEGNDPRVCPRCHNLAVQPVKKRDWFELFCVPVVPYNTSHEWTCGICQWSVPRNGPFQPMAPGHQPQFQQQSQFQQNPQYYQQPMMGPPPQGYKPPQ